MNASSDDIGLEKEHAVEKKIVIFSIETLQESDEISVIIFIKRISTK
jgi:hypothetical protein